MEWGRDSVADRQASRVPNRLTDRQYFRPADLAMVAASSSTNTATGSAPPPRAAAATWRAVVAGMLRLARGHRIMPTRLAPVGSSARWTQKAGVDAGRWQQRSRVAGKPGQPPGALFSPGQVVADRTAARAAPMLDPPASAAAAASSALVTPHTLITGWWAWSGRAAAATLDAAALVRWAHGRRCCCPGRDVRPL